MFEYAKLDDVRACVWVLNGLCNWGKLLERVIIVRNKSFGPIFIFLEKSQSSKKYKFCDLDTEKPLS